MHPEILRAMNDQRGRELRDRAHRSRLAKMANRSRRTGVTCPTTISSFPPFPTTWTDHSAPTGPSAR